MVDRNSWFLNEDLLLSAVKSSALDQARAPAIPGYEELRELGRGGQGIVYRAIQRSTNRVVAIKLLVDGALASETSRRRFEREIDLVAAMQHPHIVRLYDSGTTADGHPFYVMEYLEGTTLEEPIAAALSTPRPSIDATMNLFAKVCEAVNYAHQRGVIHRDLKPSNIRIDPAGEPHVVDFGLAKSSMAGIERADQPSLSVPCQFMGSLPWASPEQVEGVPGRLDVRTDVYSLGVLLYQLLTGRFPYSVVGTFPSIIEIIRTAAPDRPTDHRDEIDDELETIILKTLAKEPERRYQTAGELAREIGHYLRGEPIEAKRDSAWYSLKKTMRRYRLAVAVASAFVVIAVLVAITTSLLYRQARQAEQVAESRRAQAEAEVDKLRRTMRFLQGMFGSLDPAQTVDRDPGLLRQILDESAGRVEAELAGQPEVEAPVRTTIGRTYASLGDYAAAEQHLQAALALYDELPEPELSQRWQAVDGLAAVYQEQGRFAEAEPLARAALAGFRELVGPEHPDTLAAANNLTLLLHSMGRLEEADELYRETLALRRRILGEEHLDTVRSKNNLAQLLLDRGAYDEAEPLVAQVLDVRRRLLGSEHPETVTAINNAARVAQEQGRLDHAEALYREAIDGFRRILGDDHPRTLKARSNLAVLYHQQGRLTEAEALLRDVLARQRQRVEDDDPAGASVLNNLARVLQDQGRPAEAEPLLRQVFEMLEAAYGQEHPQTLTAMNNLAGMLADLQQRGEAVELFRRCYEIRRQTLGAEHTQTLLAGINLAGGLRDAGQLAEALAVFEQLGAAAAPLPAEHWLRPYLQGGHGETLVLLGRFDEAEALLLGSHRAFQTALGEQHPTTRRAAFRLAGLYRTWGKPSQAAAYESEPAE